MITFDTKLASLPRIQKKYLPKLKKLGLVTVRDLLYHLPSRYDDFSAVVPISDLSVGMNVTIIGTVTHSSTQRTWKRKMTVTNVTIQDNSGSTRAIWFNQPFVGDQLTTGKVVRMSGKISSDKKGLYLSNPAYERGARTPTNTGCLVPVYPETAGLSSRWLRWQIQLILAKIDDLPESLPDDIREKYDLPDIATALHDIHFPEEQKDAQHAFRRFTFEEVLVMQCKLALLKAHAKKDHAIAIPFDEKRIKKFVDTLPFVLTDAQRKSSFQIIRDLEKNTPMNRLLNGDVGSGKTAVAAIASLHTAIAGHQVAILAPTEILARQHFETFTKMFGNENITCALLTGAYKLYGEHPALVKKTTRPKILSLIKDGTVDVIIGTHALIQDDVHFHDLALVIVDEQHRFGVKQRAALQQNTAQIDDGQPTRVPHFLTMTATPIPRTLTMAICGNLDVSILDEMPVGRKPIITKVVAKRKRSTAYAFIRSQIKKGFQVYVIIPFVEESKAMTNVKAAIAEHKILQEEIFPDLTIGLLHGKMKAKEKEKIMKDFQEKNCDVLVATAVVEVGIDVPNATVMIIENAERFGLSQLHQFRGRIGRSKHQSYCFLFSDSFGNKRLHALEKSSDGFAIAEEDLALRGPGQFFGTQQSGMTDVMTENITNIKLITAARDTAQEILSDDPSLAKYSGLAQALAHFDKNVHLE